MRRLIPTAVIILILSFTSFGQGNRISICTGYQINLNNHWLVDKWEKPISIDLSFDHSKDDLLMGGGINYSKADVSWFRYHNSELNTISSLTPYLKVGLNLERKIVSLIPYLNLGYSALITDIEIYGGDKGGFNSAIGFDCNFDLTQKIQLGIGAKYSMAFLKIDFDYQGLINHDFIPTENNTMKSILLGLNLAYRL